jgi:hypothetical protein
VTGRGRVPRPIRLAGRWLAELLGLILVAAAAITVALWLTPMQTVTIAGQAIKVGATAPSLSLSGPGEMDLFGQRLPTNQSFTGPVRPRVQLAQITINSELTTFVEGARPARVGRRLGGRLASGWKRYFTWETAITGAGALILLGAVAGWRRMPHRATITLLAAGLATAEAINLGAIMITAYSAPAALRQVRSLNDLAGAAARVPRTTPEGRPLPAVRVVVIGDSTAAGAGLPAAAGASATAQACGRSADAYPADLAAANGWNVLNLACNGATIRQGLLGPQDHRGQRLPPQLDVAQQARHAAAVIVSVGADDLHWAMMLHYCAAAPRCDDRATTAYFQQQLASFSKDYLELLSRLAALPAHPHVIINQYYDPFGPQPGCLSGEGLTTAKLATLTARLAALNTVLANGAAQFGFSAPQPQFTGHQLCSPLSYVQSPGSPAPFHPTEMGQLAIALADQAILQTQSASQTAQPTPTATATPGPGQLAGPTTAPGQAMRRR